MTRYARTITALALTLICSSSIAAQEMRRSGGGGGLPPYDIAKEKHVSGEVTGTDTSEMPNGPNFLVLNVTVDGKPLRVLLAPAGWLKEKGVTFSAGMKVEATGVSDGMRLQGDPAMMARQVKVGAKVIALRGADGTPEWEK